MNLLNLVIDIVTTRDMAIISDPQAEVIVAEVAVMAVADLVAGLVGVSDVILTPAVDTILAPSMAVVRLPP